jgi:hypothetical protein
MPQNSGDFHRYLLLRKDSRPLGVVDIVIQVGNPVGHTDNASLRRGGLRAGGVVKKPIADFKGQIQAGSALFELFHNTDALLIMAETTGNKSV